MPGLGYGFYFPKAQDSLGFFRGMVVEFLFYADVSQNETTGPSHVRAYGKLHLMNSSKENVKNIFTYYSVGLDMSIERNPKRTFLIPYFGLETGGISNAQLGTSWHFTPILGVHLLSRQNIFINLQGAYLYPVKNFDILQGYMGKLSINFSLW
ncbi:MAG: hypothetical protein NZ551_05570 [Microscillaceae bacterium]|nr:hypothetical protein [Microscillaceae bacterium]MDW8460665.1 hypothetical protein [Cytophagales bacterium]